MVTRDALFAGLGACLLAGAFGCTEAGPLSDDEMQRLQAFQLQPLAPDSSNAKGDDRDTAKLGKLFFFDGGFSGPLGPYNVAGVNGSLGPAGASGLVSCASCHDPDSGGVDHRSVPAATSLGASYTNRNSPSVCNAAYSPLWQFWDGRKDSLWSQALSPPEGAAEGNTTRLDVAHFLASNYAQEYAAVFGPLPDLSGYPASGKPMDPSWENLPPADQKTVNTVYANFGKAIAAYERLLTSPNFAPSAFDRFMGGDKEAMSPAAIRGARLFIGHAGCAECHSGPMFTDYKFHNIGAPQQGQYVPTSDDGREDGVAGLWNDPFNRRGDFSDSPSDAHLIAFQNPLTDDQKNDLDGLFKTPSLRNVSKTAPYMHDGVYTDLWEVVNHYNFGGESGNYSGEKDPAISPLLLGDGDLDDLIEFLQALEDGPPNDANFIATFPEGLTKAPPCLPGRPCP
jgi:cytochrome c peroxidase